VTRCLYEKSTPIGFQKWKTYRNQLQSNQDFIHVTDFGAGSKVFSSNKRQVSKIAKHAGISKKRARLLMKLTTYFNFQNVLEIGTSVGLGTSAIALGNPEANVVTLEGCQETTRVAQNMFDQFDLSNIKVTTGDFKNSLGKSLSNSKYDLIYFDGNHSKEATIQYFEQCLPNVHNDTLFLFDDIHWSQDMEAAWDFIQKYEKVTVSIDTFQWGLVFFRKEQQKEHFIIRV
jgi:predicted O-methyltransferase YrrM